MGAERIVVVGASLAGLRAAQGVRAAGHEGSLVVIGDESHRPYTRPPLSKQLLAGEQTAPDTALRHKEEEAEWRLGVAAARLDRDRHVVVLADGDEVPYDRVIVATGCRARSWPGEGAGLAGIHTLRGLDDALALKDAVDRSGRLVIVGAGFIGCEVAATARAAGVEVDVIDIAPHPMIPLGPELGARCADLHRDRGVRLHLGTGVAGFEGTGAVEAVTLTDGTRLEADAVVIALGAVPNVEWLRDSGLDVDSGLACDDTLTAVGDPDVLGAGDAISWPDPLAAARVRIEHWTVASDHGGHAGRNAVLEHAEREPFTIPPYFWSDQYDVKIQALGFPDRADRLEVLEASEDGVRFVAAGARDGRLIGVVAFNAARRLNWYRQRLPEAPGFDALRAEVLADEKALGAAVSPPR